jgi:4-carboxymuconolactone decarboxylase
LISVKTEKNAEVAKRRKQMKKMKLVLILLSLSTLTPIFAEIKVFKPETQSPPQAGADHFTGTVHNLHLLQAEEPSLLACGHVKFDPSSRTAWHKHPRGQLLVVTEGSGLIQAWGAPAKKIEKGDVVWTPPGVKHWHGATPDSSLTHIAIQETLDKKYIEWLEKVSEDQYLSALR